MVRWPLLGWCSKQQKGMLQVTSRELLVRRVAAGGEFGANLPSPFLPYSVILVERGFHSYIFAPFPHRHGSIHASPPTGSTPSGGGRVLAPWGHWGKGFSGRGMLKEGSAGRATISSGGERRGLLLDLLKRETRHRSRLYAFTCDDMMLPSMVLLYECVKQAEHEECGEVERSGEELSIC
jgi:hypothetical protein